MPHVASYILLVHDAEQRLADALELVGRAHGDDAELVQTTRHLAERSRQQVAALTPVLDQYRDRRDEHAAHEPERFFSEPIAQARTGPIGKLRDLQDLLALTAFVNSTWTVVDQGAKAMKDERLKAVCEHALQVNEQEARWLRTHLKAAAPQALLLAQ